MSVVKAISITVNLKALRGVAATTYTPLYLGTGTAAKQFQIFEADDISAALVDAGYLETDHEYLAALAYFAQSPTPRRLAIARKDDLDTYTEALTAIRAAGNRFYGVLLQTRDKTALHSAGDWAAANRAVLIAAADDLTLPVDRDNDREMFWCSKAITDNAGTVYAYPDAAVAGMAFTGVPGAKTFAWKALQLTKQSGYTDAQTAQLKNDDGNYFGLAENSDVIVTYPGVSSSGLFTDLIFLSDYVADQIVQSLQRLLIKTDKITYDVPGFQQWIGAIRAPLDAAGANRQIAAATTEEELANSDNQQYQYRIIVPDPLDVSEQDRANRKIPTEVTFRVAGAVHDADVVLNLEV